MTITKCYSIFIASVNLPQINLKKQKKKNKKKTKKDYIEIHHNSKQECFKNIMRFCCITRFPRELPFYGTFEDLFHSLVS